MDFETFIKGAIVFALTFGTFVLARPGDTIKPSDPQTTKAATPAETPVPPDEHIGEQSDPAAIAPTPDLTVPATGTIADNQVSAESSSDETNGVKDILSKWKSAIASNNPESESSCYAPMLSKYFGQSKVANSIVRSNRQSFLDEGNRVTSVDLGQIRIDIVSPSSATVHLVKDITWQTANGVQIQRKTASTVTLEDLSDGWKIVSEQNSH